MANRAAGRHVALPLFFFYVFVWSLSYLVPLLSRSSIGYAPIPWIGVLFFTEVGKFVVSAALALTSCPKSSHPVWKSVTRDWKEGVLYVIPALPMVVGNVLQTQFLVRVSLSSFHVILSTRILFVGMLVVVALKRRLNGQQWVGLAALTLAAACVQSNHFEWIFQIQFLVMSTIIAFIGAFGDVSCEKLLKKQCDMSFYWKNTYLFACTSGMTLLFAVVTQWDFLVIFYYGYNLSSIVLVLCGVMYGLGTSIILYRLDAITKQFAWVSTLLFVALFVWFLDQVMYLGIFGAFILLGVSTILYYDHFSLSPESEHNSDNEAI